MYGYFACMYVCSQCKCRREVRNPGTAGKDSCECYVGAENGTWKRTSSLLSHHSSSVNANFIKINTQGPTERKSVFWKCLSSSCDKKLQIRERSIECSNKVKEVQLRFDT